MLLNILIVFFIFLISYQIILANSHIIEGAENQGDTAGDAYRLSQKNSAEISLIKDSQTKSEEKANDRMDKLDEDMKEVMQSVKELGDETSKPLQPQEEE